MSVIMVMVFAAVAMAGFAFAGGSCDVQGRSDSCQKDKMDAMAKELNLTADQEKSLKESREACRSKAKDLSLKLRERREALRKEISKPGVTRQQVESILSEIKAIQSEMIDQRVDGIFKVKAILTPEQFARLQAKREAKTKSGKMHKAGKGW